MDSFGFGSLDLNVDDFSTTGNVIQLGVPPVRVDLLTSITGVTWDDAYNNKVAGSYGDIAVYYIGLKQFETNKRAVGRTKDLADLESLDKNKSK